MKNMVYVLFVAMIALVGCGKDKGNKNDNYGYGNNCGYGSGYNNRYNNGYNNRNYGNSQGVYQWRNNVCVDARTNRRVEEYRCQNANYGNNNGYNNGYNNNRYGNNCYGSGYNNGFGGGYNNGYGYNNYGYGQVGVTSPQCQYLARPGFYYQYMLYPGLGQYMCVEYSTGFEAYPYGQPAYNYGGGFGFYGYIRL